MLVWIDLETTGLVASKEKILEVAAVITTDDLVEVARFQRVTTEAKHCDLSQVDPYVIAMHVKNGLWNESLLAIEFGYSLVDANSIAATDANLAAFIQSTVADHVYAPRYLAGESVGQVNWELWADPPLGEKKGPQLAGSTISFDRAFMQAHLPRAHALLHYRNYDTSTLNEFAKRLWPKVFDARPRSGAEPAHRAMADVLESLEVARYYARVLGPVTSVEVAA